MSLPFPPKIPLSKDATLRARSRNVLARKKSSRKSRFACVSRTLTTFARRKTVSHWARTKYSEICRPKHPILVQNHQSPWIRARCSLKSSRISALTIASKLGKHTSSSDSCLCARSYLFKRVYHRTKTHTIKLGGKNSFLRNWYYIYSSKDANAKTASCERRGSYLAVAHSHHLRRRLYFFSCTQTLVTVIRAKRRSTNCVKWCNLLNFSCVCGLFQFSLISDWCEWNDY